MTRVAVAGATGHMGRTVLALAADRADVDPVVAFARDPDDAAPPAGVTVVADGDAAAALDGRAVDALVDFTAPAATRRYVAACAETGTAAVVGTTGLDGEDRAALVHAAERAPVLHATNFSRGLLALRRAVREAVATLPDADVEVTETHHRRKVDAPSGTAETLADDVDAARDRTAERVHGRAGEAPRSDGEVGVHARRAGGLAGEHEVLLAEGPEALTLAHRAESREPFAAGALDAAAWLAGRAPGRYELAEVFE